MHEANEIIGLGQKLKHYLIVWLAAVVGLPAFSADTPSYNDLTLYTEENPPFNYRENGEVRGASVDLLLELFRHLKVDKRREEIVILPWARGYSETQRRKNALLFATVRTPERETLFKWVGPISDGNVALLGRADGTARLSNPNDFAKRFFGVSKTSREEQLLLSAGADPEKFLYVQSNDSALHMLARGRFDFWARDVAVMSWTLKKGKFDKRAFKVVYSFDKLPLYFALNKDTDENIVKNLQAALEVLRSNGTLSAINDRYFGTMFAAIR